MSAAEGPVTEVVAGLACPAPTTLSGRPWFLTDRGGSHSAARHGPATAGRPPVESKSEAAPPARKREISVAKKASGATKKATRSMSEEHKAALAEGREQGRAVRRYLEALESTKPRRGRKRTPESIQKRLAAIDEQLGSADPLSRVHLVQERMDLEEELAAGSNQVNLDGLEADFMAAAGPYAQRKGISYDAWRAAGVEARVLRAAGIGRGQ